VGFLTYNDEQFDFEDRVLWHLQIVISTKLRRRENFFLIWNQAVERGSGRHAVWVDNGVPIHFTYNGTRNITVNRQWVEEMLLSASRASGLQLTEEPHVPE
jgi:hypothetical protein